MIQSGLASAALPGTMPAKIVELAVSCGLGGIEWSITHVQPEQIALAKAMRDLTLAAHLRVVAYDTEWRPGQGGFAAILNTAVILDAPAVQVFVGDHSSESTCREEREAVCEGLRRACEIARKAGKSIAVKPLRNTLADTHRSRLRLMREVGHPNLRLCWSPSLDHPHEDRLDDLTEVLPYLSNVHVTQTRTKSAPDRSPTRSETEWREYLRLASKRKRFALLRAVSLSDPHELHGEATVLRSWISNLTKS